MKHYFRSFINISSVFIVIFSIFSVVSCNGFFGVREKFDKGPEIAEPGMEVVHFIATGNFLEAARTAMPASNFLESMSNISAYTNWRLTATTDNDRVFKEKTWEYSGGVSSLVLYSDTKYNFTLSATYKNGETGRTAEFSGTAQWESGQTSINFVMKSQSSGVLTCNLTFPEIDGMEAKVWVSKDVNSRNDSEEIRNYSIGGGNLSFSHSDLKPGKYYLSILLNDKGEETFVGPEIVYIFPALETAYEATISDLNRTYKLKFSLDSEFGSWADGVTEAEKALDVGLYRAFYDFPAVDKINPPAGYWYDGSWYAIIDEEAVVFDKENPLSYSVVQYLITDNYEVTLYPHFRGGYITKDVNVDDIPTIVEKSYEDYSYSVKFGEDIPDEIWNATIQVLGQKSGVTLDLSNVSQEMFSRACPKQLMDDELSGNELATLAGAGWLGEVILPKEGTEVPAYAFLTNGYSTLKVFFPEESKYVKIGDYAFRGQQYVKISVPEGVKEIGAHAYEGAGEYAGYDPLPDSLEKIGDCAFFQSCISDVTIPKNVVSIGEGAFQQYSYTYAKLSSVAFAEGSKLESIGDSAFAGSAIESMTLPDSLKTIGISAFEDCEGLKSVKIPDSVESIGHFAFKYCTSLTSVEIPGSVQVLPRTMLYYCDKASVTVKSAFGAADNWDNWFSVGPKPECFDKNTPFVLGLRGDDKSAYFIREFNVKDENLAVKIQNAVSAICPDEEPNENIIIPVVLVNPTGDNLTVYDLKNANLFNLGVKWSTKESVMVDFSSLTVDSGNWTSDILGSNDNVSSIRLPDGITGIFNEAFANRTSLTSITIPKSVVAIGDRAFVGCRETLKLIYEGTEAEWNGVAKGDNAIPAGVSVTCKMGSGNRTYSVGDFILKDGTVLSKDSTPVSGTVAAVIVRAADEGTPALGVGIVNRTDGLIWCTESAEGFNKSITALVGDKTSGFMDGSEGWEKLKEACSDAESNPDYYPAWNWCLTYASTNGLTGDLADGWYLPTLAELAAIQQNITTVDESLEKAGGSKLGSDWFLSCCQDSVNSDSARSLYFEDGEISYSTKNDHDFSVCCVRVFN
ncbi:MAG: leucine-rich repeat domain-containing protein [Treponemataceae bacterium]|nr:leucine-rich repeat domain-containing protein [Treponemataceae bacterium]